MKGFLSEGVRDIITLIGLIWTIIQIIITIFSRVPNQKSLILKGNSGNRNVEESTSSKWERQFLIEDSRDGLATFLVSVVLVFILSALLHYVSKENKGLIINLFMVVFIYQFVSFGMFLSGLDEWLMNTLSNGYQKKTWRILIALSWFFLLLLCVGSIGRFDPASNWFNTGLAIEMGALFVGTLIMLLYLTYKMIKKLFV